MLIKVSFPCNLFTLGKINIKNNGLYGCHSIKDCCYCVHSALVVCQTMVCTHSYSSIKANARVNSYLKGEKNPQVTTLFMSNLCYW